MQAIIGYELAKLSDWLDGSKSAAIEQRIIKFMESLGLYNPSYQTVRQRSLDNRYLPDSVREALSFVTSTGSLDEPNFHAALVRLHEWWDREYESSGCFILGKAAAILERWSVSTQDESVPVTADVV
jgi:hypothetical protein